MKRGLVVGALAAMLIVPLARAQTAAPQRLRGTVVSVSATTLVIQTSARQISLALAPDWQPAAVVASSLAAITPGSFIGTAATGPDSHLVAREVVVFPPAMKGTGEGHYPWDLGPESTMTNATVDAEAVGADGRSLKLSYKGGTVSVLVPPGVPIVTLEPGDRAIVVPGAHVLVVATQSAAGFSALRVAVGKDGLTPPM